MVFVFLTKGTRKTGMSQCANILPIIVSILGFINFNKNPMGHSSPQGWLPPHPWPTACAPPAPRWSCWWGRWWPRPPSLPSCLTPSGGSTLQALLYCLDFWLIQWFYQPRFWIILLLLALIVWGLLLLRRLTRWREGREARWPPPPILSTFSKPLLFAQTICLHCLIWKAPEDPK